MDKAGIFAEIVKRNALRRANFLPPLDVSAEYAHEIAVAAQRDYQTSCAEHGDEREVIRQQVLAEYRDPFGPTFGYTMGGRWAVGEMTRKRFAAFMSDRHRVSQPTIPVSRNAVTYGEAREDAAQPPSR